MKTKTVFFCTECGNETAKWAGRCPSCGAWNTIVEQAAPKETVKGKRYTEMMPRAKARQIDDLEIAEELRFATGMRELDRVLGGGAVKGSLVLIGGAPGIGKSTLMIQTAAAIAKKYGKVNLVPLAVDYLFMRDNRPEVWVEFGDIIELTDSKIDRKEYSEYLAKTLETLCDNQLQNLSHARFDGYETLFQQKLKWYRAFEQHLKKIKENATKK